MTQHASLKREAIKYAEQGWRAICMHTASDWGCSCSKGPVCQSPGKHNKAKYSPHGANEPYASPEVIAGWEEPFNLGIGLGQYGDDNVYCLDVDNPKVATDMIDPMLPLRGTTAIATTGRGTHVWLKSKTLHRNFNPKSVDGHKLGEFRGGGMLVVVPPSIHKTGTQYKWLADVAGEERAFDGMPEIIEVDDPLKYVRGLYAMVGETMAEPEEAVDFAEMMVDGLPGGAELPSISVAELPDALRTASVLYNVRIQMRGIPLETLTGERSEMIYGLAKRIADCATSLSVPIDLKFLAGCVKQADAVSYHCYTDDRPWSQADKEYLRIAAKVLAGIQRPGAQATVPAPAKATLGADDVEEMTFENDDEEPEQMAFEDDDPAPHAPNVEQNAAPVPPTQIGPTAPTPSGYLWDEDSGSLLKKSRRNKSTDFNLIANFFPQIVGDYTMLGADGQVVRHIWIVRMYRAHGSVEFVLDERDLKSSNALRSAINRACPSSFSVAAGRERDLLPAMQELSEGNTVRGIVPSTTGWIEHDGAHKFVFPNSKGAITADGLDIRLQLSDALLPHGEPILSANFRHYGEHVRPATTDAERESAWRALRNLIEAASTGKSSLLVLCVLAGPLRSNGLSKNPPLLHVLGPSGSLKTSLALATLSIFGHFSSRAGRRGAGNSPETWTSTPKAIQSSLHVLKDLPLLIDDFKSSVLVKNSELVMVVQNYSDGTNRSRLAGDQSRRTSQSPRALLISTGEEVWADQPSVISRTLVVEVGGGDIYPAMLSIAQRAVDNGELQLFGGTYLSWLARTADVLIGDEFHQLRRAREEQLKLRVHGAHPRLVETAAGILAVADIFRRFVAEVFPAHADEAKKIANEAGRELMVILRKGQESVIAKSPLAHFLDDYVAATESRTACTIAARDPNCTRIPNIPENRPNSCIGWHEQMPDGDLRLFLTERQTFLWMQNRRGLDRLPFDWCTLRRALIQCGGIEKRDRMDPNSRAQTMGVWISLSKIEAAVHGST